MIKKGKAAPKCKKSKRWMRQSRRKADGKAGMSIKSPEKRKGKRWLRYCRWQQCGGGDVLLTKKDHLDESVGL